MRNDPKSFASNTDEVNIRIVSTSFTSVCADRGSVRIVASPGFLLWLFDDYNKSQARSSRATADNLLLSGCQWVLGELVWQRVCVVL